MASLAFNLRLQHLEANIKKILELLNEYEIELADEDDPGKKSKYRRRIEDLSQQRIAYEKEFVELQAQLAGKQAPQVQNIANQLHQIDGKLNLLLDSQVTLHQALMSHFSTREQTLILPITEQLKEPQLIEMQAVLEAVDANQISEPEIQKLLTETRQLLTVMREHNLALPGTNNAVIEMINGPSLDAKHALKISVPIIPFILSYEGELGLGAGFKLKESWESLKKRLQRRH